MKEGGMRTAKKSSKLASLLNEGDGRMELRLPEEAIPYYTKALEIDPENAAGWNSLGLASYLVKDYAKGLMCFETALQINPDFAEAWGNKGNLLVKLERYPEAFDCYDAAIQKNPMHPVAIWGDKGRAYYAAGKYEEAITCFDQALALHQDHLESVVGKGSALCKLGYFQEAVRCYDRALQINPLSTRARVYRKIALDNLERSGGSRQRRIRDFPTR
jgi:tetratricopeptide (TPR) repeat protein